MLLQLTLYESESNERVRAVQFSESVLINTTSFIFMNLTAGTKYKAEINSTSGGVNSQPMYEESSTCKLICKYCYF